jgi:hypothetical protein
VNLSLKPPLISTLIVLLFAVTLPLFAQQKESLTPLAFSQSAYRVGERLTYNVSFSNFPSAAHVEVEVVASGVFFSRDAIQLRGHVETTDIVNVALFAINNDYTTYIDRETGLPFRSEETARDAIKSAEAAENFFNQPAGNEAIPPRQRGFPGTYDFLSAFYRARSLPLAEGGEYNFSVRGQAGTYQAEVKVAGRDIIRTNVGSFSTIVAQIKVNSPTVRNLKIYFSDDERRVPVLLTARVSGGELRAELAGSEIVSTTTGGAQPTPTPEIIAGPMPTPSTVPPPGPVASPTASNSASVPVPTTLGEHIPFTPGEQLNYQVFIGSGNTPLGLATFQVRARSRYFDRDGLLLTVNAQTTGAAASLFVARDQIDSYVDPKALLPFRTVMNLVEGQRRLNQTITFDQDNGTASSDKGKRIEIPVGTHDYLSFFYALRTFDLTPQKKSAFSMLVEDSPKTMFVDSIKRESIQLGDRKVPAMALTITTDDPQPDKYQLRIWVSDDHRRLPLRFTCMTQLGPLRADLAILPTSAQ